MSYFLSIKLKSLVWQSIGLYIVLLTSCKDPFEPPAAVTATSYLVVEGYINGTGRTSIKLSRTGPLSKASALQPETNAQVRIDGSKGSTFVLSSNSDGIYEGFTSGLSTDEQYRVHIKTADSKEYVSDYVDYKITPAIGQLSWQKQPNGVQIFLDTHDPENQTKFYRWDYDETWEFNSIDKSFYEWSESQQTLVNRTNIEELYTCWRTEPSRRILLNSSARLQKDIITNHPLAFISDTSQKLHIRYSILAKQYALTKEAFEYWQQMVKNTEQLGAVFDAQPVELKGNIRCVSDPNELVIGFISAGTVEEKRIFIDHREVPEFIYKSTECNKRMVSATDKIILRSYFSRGMLIPLDYRSTDDGPKYTYSTKECVDCRTKGTNIKPSFW